MGKTFQWGVLMEIKRDRYLNKLISLESLFEINQIIETNYGSSTIIEIKKDYLIVDVPSLGKREIYDISSIK